MKTPNLDLAYSALRTVRARLTGEQSARELLPYCTGSIDEYMEDLRRFNEAVEAFSRAADSGESFEHLAILASGVSSECALLEHAFCLLRTEFVGVIKALPAVKGE